MAQDGVGPQQPAGDDPFASLPIRRRQPGAAPASSDPFATLPIRRRSTAAAPAAAPAAPAAPATEPTGPGLSGPYDLSTRLPPREEPPMPAPWGMEPEHLPDLQADPVTGKLTRTLFEGQTSPEAGAAVFGPPAPEGAATATIPFQPPTTLAQRTREAPAPVRPTIPEVLAARRRAGLRPELEEYGAQPTVQPQAAGPSAGELMAPLEEQARARNAEALRRQRVAELFGRNPQDVISTILSESGRAAWRGLGKLVPGLEETGLEAARASGIIPYVPPEVETAIAQRRAVQEARSEAESPGMRTVEETAPWMLAATGMEAALPALAPEVAGATALERLLAAGARLGRSSLVFGGASGATAALQGATPAEVGRAAVTGGEMGLAFGATAELLDAAAARAQAILDRMGPKKIVGADGGVTPGGTAGYPPGTPREIVAAARKDWYGVLGLDRETSTMDKAKRAYRRLAQKWHPDRNPAPLAGEVQKVVNAAWSAVQEDLRGRGPAAPVTEAGTEQAAGAYAPRGTPGRATEPEAASSNLGGASPAEQQVGGIESTEPAASASRAAGTRSRTPGSSPAGAPPPTGSEGAPLATPAYTRRGTPGSTAGPEAVPGLRTESTVPRAAPPEQPTAVLAKLPAYRNALELAQSLSGAQRAAAFEAARAVLDNAWYAKNISVEEWREADRALDDLERGGARPSWESELGKYAGVSEAGAPGYRVPPPTIVPTEAVSTHAGGWTPLPKGQAPVPGSAEDLTRAVEAALTGPNGEDLVQQDLFGRQLARRVPGFGLYAPEGEEAATLFPNTIHVFPAGTPPAQIRALAKAQGFLKNQEMQIWLQPAEPGPDAVPGYWVTPQQGQLTPAQLKAFQQVVNADARFAPLRVGTLMAGRGLFADFTKTSGYTALLQAALDAAGIEADIEPDAFAGAQLSDFKDIADDLPGGEPAALGRLGAHLDAIEPAYRAFGAVNGLKPDDISARFDAFREAAGLPGGSAPPVGPPETILGAAVRRPDGTFVEAATHPQALATMSAAEQAAYNPLRDRYFVAQHPETGAKRYVRPLEAQRILEQQYPAFKDGPPLSAEELKTLPKKKPPQVSEPGGPGYRHPGNRAYLDLALRLAKARPDWDVAKVEAVATRLGLLGQQTDEVAIQKAINEGKPPQVGEAAPAAYEAPPTENWWEIPEQELVANPKAPVLEAATRLNLGRPDISGEPFIEQLKAAMRIGGAAVRRAEQMFPEAKIWYTKNAGEAFTQLAEERLPDLKDPNRRAVFKLTLAIFSNGTTVTDNPVPAIQTWDGFNQSGQLKRIGYGGVRQAAWDTGLKKLNALIQERGVQGTIDYLMEPVQVRATARLGLPARQVYRVVDTFGPKVGRFWLNLHGLSDEVVVDKWMVRWWNFVLGKTPRMKFDKTVGMLIPDESVNETVRYQITQAVTRISQALIKRTGDPTYTPSAVQSLLWHDIQYRYSQAGETTFEPGHYKGAIAQYLEAEREEGPGGAAAAPAGGAGAGEVEAGGEGAAAGAAAGGGGAGAPRAAAAAGEGEARVAEGARSLVREPGVPAYGTKPAEDHLAAAKAALSDPANTYHVAAGDRIDRALAALRGEPDRLSENAAENIRNAMTPLSALEQMGEATPEMRTALANLAAALLDPRVTVPYEAGKVAELQPLEKYQAPAQFSEQMELTFGNQETHQAAAELALKANQVPTLDQRLKLIPTKDPQAVSVIGKRLASAQDAALVNAPFRSPRAETYLLDLTKRGKIVGRVAVVSGVLNHANVPVGELVYQIDELAERLGADGVVEWHNHPSGNPTPSEDDMRTAASLDVMLRELRRSKGRKQLRHTHYVSNFDKITKMVVAPRAGRTEVTVQPNIPVTPAPKDGPDWTEVRGPEIDSPQQVLQVAPKPSASVIHVLYRDNAGRAIALAPHAKSAVADIRAWLPKEMADIGAMHAIVLTPMEDVPLWQQLTQFAPDQVLDVIAMHQDGTWESAATTGQLIYRSPRHGGRLGETPTAPYEAAGAGAEPPEEERKPKYPPGTVGAVPPGLDPDFAVHINNLRADPEGLRATERRVRRLKETGRIGPNQRVSFDQIRAMSKGLSVDEILQQPKNQALTGPEGVALRDEYDANDQVLEGIYRKLVDGEYTLSEADKAFLERSANALEERGNKILERFVPGASQQGRDFVALRMGAKDSLDPSYWAIRAKRILGPDRPLTDAIRTEMAGYLNRKDPKGLTDYLATLRQGDIWDLLTHSYVVNLISSFNIYPRALTGGLTHHMMELAADPIAAGMDALISGVNGLERTSAFNEQMVTATAKGAAIGARNAVRLVRGQTIYDPLAGRAGGSYQGEVHYDHPMLEAWNKVLNFVGRTHGAYMSVIGRAGTERSLAEQAAVMAKNEKLSGDAYLARVKELREKPTSEMVMRAIEYGARMSLTNQTILAQVASGARKTLASKGGAIGKLAGVWAMPIVRVPANVAAREAEFTLGLPVAVLYDLPRFVLRALADSKTMPPKVKAALDQAIRLAGVTGKPGATSAAQRDFVKRFARGLVGGAAMVAGYEMAKHGLLTGALPENAQERRQWAQINKKPFSLYHDGRWLAIGAIVPLGMELVLGATFYQLAERAKTHPGESPVPEAAGEAAKVFMSQPMVTGPASISEAAQHPMQAAGRLARQTVGSMVPLAGALRSITRLTDKTQRRPGTIGEQIRSEIPGLSQTVPPARDAWGQPIEHPWHVSNLWNFLMPSEDLRRKDPVLREADRVGAVVPVPKRGLIKTVKGGREVREPEPQDAYEARLRGTGQQVRQAWQAEQQSEEYQNAAQDARWLLEQNDERVMGMDLEEATRWVQKYLLEDLARQRVAFVRGTIIEPENLQPDTAAARPEGP